MVAVGLVVALGVAVIQGVMVAVGVMTTVAVGVVTSSREPLLLLDRIPSPTRAATGSSGVDCSQTPARSREAPRAGREVDAGHRHRKWPGGSPFPARSSSAT